MSDRPPETPGEAPRPAGLSPDYYLRNFERVLGVVSGSAAHLFTPEEAALFRGFSSLPEAPKRAYVRLYLRRGPVFRASRLSYPEIAPLPGALDALVGAGFLADIAAPSEDMPPAELLRAVGLPELAELARRLGLPHRGRKDELVERLSADARSWELWRALDRFVALKHRALFRIAEVAFFGNRHQDLSEFVLVDIERVRYPAYEIARDLPLFQSRAALEAYLASAARWEAGVAGMSPEELSAEAARALAALEGWAPPAPHRRGIDPGRYETRQAFAAARELERRGAPGEAAAIYLRLASPGPEIGLRAEAADRLGLLAMSRPPSPARGAAPTPLPPGGEAEGAGTAGAAGDHRPPGLSPRGSARIDAGSPAASEQPPAGAGDHDDTLQEPGDNPLVERFSAAAAALLSCPEVDAIARFRLEYRGARLGLGAAPKARLLAPEVVELSLAPAGYAGPKALYLGPTSGEALPIEEAALEALGGDGVFAENALYRTLFGLLLWDEIFAPVPGVFQHAFQAGPLDALSEHFFPNRAGRLSSRLEALAAADIPAELSRAYEAHAGEASYFVHWEAYDLATLCRAAESLGGALPGILARLARNPHRHGRGLPDLLLWPGGRAALVEVKGPGDAVHIEQRLWHDRLLRLGLAVKLARVRRP